MPRSMLAQRLNLANDFAAGHLPSYSQPKPTEHWHAAATCGRSHYHLQDSTARPGRHEPPAVRPPQIVPRLARPPRRPEHWWGPGFQRGACCQGPARRRGRSSPPLAPRLLAARRPCPARAGRRRGRPPSPPLLLRPPCADRPQRAAPQGSRTRHLAGVFKPVCTARPPTHARVSCMSPVSVADFLYCTTQQDRRHLLRSQALGEGENTHLCVLAWSWRCGRMPIVYPQSVMSHTCVNTGSPL